MTEKNHMSDVAQAVRGPSEPLQCLRCGTIDAFGPVSKDTMDKTMMDALRADAEKLAQLTGQDHTPEFLADCEACDGKGYIARTIHVHEAGCGFSHPDVEEKPCEACGGNGWLVIEAEAD